MGRLDGPFVNFWAQLGPKHNCPEKVLAQLPAQKLEMNVLSYSLSSNVSLRSILS